MWFDRSARLDYDDHRGCLQVAVPNRFVADWIGRNFESDLRRAVNDEVGDGVELDVHVAPQRFAGDDPPASPASAAATTAATAHTPHARRPPSLRHRLEDFVVGASNELAFAAANRFVEDDHANCNPLFIHGGCGLGKTHLLQGICRKSLDLRPTARVLYATAEQFTNEFLFAIRNNRIEPFRRKIRRLDLLALDDVHFIANKQATQREFLHSFDAIELGGARVVLASDSHPKLIHCFSEALISRCVRGMVVQVHQPDTATRLRIVHALAQRRGIPLTEAVVNTISTRSLGSVREIEGTLTKLHALASLTETHNRGDGPNGAIGHALVNRLFETPPHATPRRAVRFQAILDVVAEQLAISRETILSRGRHRHTVLARGLLVHLARKLTAMSYPEIAAAMGRKHHSSIVNAAQNIQKQLTQGATLTLPVTLETLGLGDLIDRLHRAIVQA